MRLPIDIILNSCGTNMENPAPDISLTDRILAAGRSAGRTPLAEMPPPHSQSLSQANQNNTGFSQSTQSEMKASLMKDINVMRPADLFSAAVLDELLARSHTELVEYFRSISDLSKPKAGSTSDTGSRRRPALVENIIYVVQRKLVEALQCRDLLHIAQLNIELVKPAAMSTLIHKLLEPLTLGELNDDASEPTQTQGSNTWKPATPEGFISALELLPKLVSVAETGDNSGRHTEEVVKKICNVETWPAACGVGLAQVLRDLTLTEHQLPTVIKRILKHIQERRDLQALPPLSYQLLVLAGKGSGEIVLSGLVKVFDELDRKSEAADAAGEVIRTSDTNTKELRAIEGTVLLHCSYAMRQEHELAATLLKSFKRDSASLTGWTAATPFRLSLLLTLSRCGARFSVSALDAIKDLALECFTYQHRISSSAWLSGAESTFRVEAASSSSRQAPPPTPEHPDKHLCDSLLKIALWGRGWDHLTPALLDLGFKFLDHQIVSGAFGQTTAAKLSAQSRALTASQLAGKEVQELGQNLLLEVFAQQELARRKIVTEVLASVAGNLCAGGGSGASTHLRLLGTLAARHPALLLEHSGAVREAFSFLGGLTVSAARQFLTAVSPLLCLRPQLREAVVLPLRKALFSRSEQARTIAVEGLIMLLQLHTKVRNNEGGGSALGLTDEGNTDSSMTSSGCSFTVAEGFSLLRRCLTQQAAVRSRLYVGILGALSEEHAGEALMSHAVTMFSGHLKRFVNPSPQAGAAPIILSRALDQQQGYCIIEPLPQLIAVLSIMATAGGGQIDSEETAMEDVNEPNTDPRAALTKELNALVGHMLGTEMSDFDLDKHCTFSLATEDGRKNLSTAALYVGVLESLMCAKLRGTPASGLSDETLRMVLTLVKKRRRVVTVVKEGLAQAAADAKKANEKGKADADEDEGETEGGAGANHAPKPITGVGTDANGVFTLTLQHGGLPCIGLSFAETMLATLNEKKEKEKNDDTHDEYGMDEEVDRHKGKPPKESAKNDVELHKLVLETARVHLRAMKIGLRASSTVTNLMLEVGGGAISDVYAQEGESHKLSSDATQTAMRKCTVLAPLLIQEAHRQIKSGSCSSDIQEALETAAEERKKNKGKKKAKGSPASPRAKRTPEESHAEMAFSALHECITVAAGAGETIQESTVNVQKVLQSGLAHKMNAQDSSESTEETNTSTCSVDLMNAGGGVLTPLHRQARVLLSMLKDLLNENNTKEAEIVIKILMDITPLIPHGGGKGASAPGTAGRDNDPLQSYLKDMIPVCCHKKADKCAQSLVALMLRARLEAGAVKGDLVHVKDICEQLRNCLGPISSEEDTEQPPRRASQIPELTCITHKTASAVAEAVVGALEKCMDAIEYALKLLIKETITFTAMKILGTGGGSEEARPTARKGGSDSESEEEEVEEEREHDGVDRREAMLCSRLRLIFGAIDPLLKSKLLGKPADRLLTIVNRTFKVMTKTLQSRVSAKRGWIVPGLSSLLTYRKEFCQHLHAFLLDVHNELNDEGKKPGPRLDKRTRLIPDLVYQTEQCDVVLLKLSKLCKSPKDVVKWVHQASARDFKIRASKVNMLMEAAEEKKREKEEKKAKKNNSTQAGKKRKAASTGKSAKSTVGNKKKSKKKQEEEEPEPDEMDVDGSEEEPQVTDDEETLNEETY